MTCPSVRSLRAPRAFHLKRHEFTSDVDEYFRHERTLVDEGWEFSTEDGVGDVVEEDVAAENRVGDEGIGMRLVRIVALVDGDADGAQRAREHSRLFGRRRRVSLAVTEHDGWNDAARFLARRVRA